MFDWGGGCEILLTPGHTPGHLSIRALDGSFCVTGDAAVREGTDLAVANPGFCLDLDEAEKLYQTGLWAAGREVSLNLAGLYNAAYRREDWTRALACADMALAVERTLGTGELGGLSSSLYMLRAEVLRRQGRLDEAMEGLTEYVNRSLEQWARLRGGEEIRSAFFDKLNMRGSGMSTAYLAKYVRAALEENEELAVLREREDFRTLLARLAEAEAQSAG